MIALWGANGFIGRHLTHFLSGSNIPLKLFARHYDDFPFILPESAQPIIADFAKPESYINQMQECSVIVLMVSASAAGTFAHAPEQEILHNVNPYRIFFENLQENKIIPEHIIYLSSGGTVYGITEQHPIPETHPTNPINPYGKGKIEIEKNLMDYGALSGTAYTILRVANPVGVWSKKISLIPAALNAIETAEPLNIQGNGSAVRDYFDVGELARAIDLVIKTPETRNSILNIGSGHGQSINQVIDKIEQISKKSVPVRYTESQEPAIQYNVLDCRRIHDYTGWAAVRPLEDVITAMWEER